MPIAEIISIITVGGSSLLGVLVLSRTSARAIRYSFVGLVACTCGWIITLALFYNHHPSLPLLFIGRLNFGFGILVGYFVVIFTYYFPKKTAKRFARGLKLGVHLWMIVLFLITTFTALIDENEYLVNGEIVTEFGPLYFLYLLTLIFCMAAGVYFLVLNYKRLEEIYRKQIYYFLIGLSLSFLFVSITNIVLPLLGNFSFQQTAPIFTLFFLGFTFYAIVRYRLLNVKVIITRSLLYLLLTICISVLFIVLFLVLVGNVEGLGINQYLIWAGVALVIVIGLDPFKRFLARVTDNLFYKEKINYNVELRTLSNRINEEIELEALINDFTAALCKRLKLQNASVLLAADEGRVYLPLEYYTKDGFGEHKQELYDNSPFIQYVSRERETVVTDELDRKMYDMDDAHQQAQLQEVFHNLEELSAGAVVPVVRSERITALLLVGRKSSGETFSNEDITLFEVLANQLAAALERSKLYQKVQTFNAKLQEEVDRQTTELKKKNVALEEANERLKKLDKAKSEFMSIASHQLRTPLTGIVGYLSMIQDGSFGELNDELEGVVENVSDASERLVRLVNTLLSVTQIEAGRFMLNVSEGDIVSLVAKEVHDLQPTAKARGVELQFDRPENEILLNMDPDKVRDVVINLVDNGIKYTEEGGTVTVHLERKKNVVQFSVEDNGIGIPKEEVGKLFSKFVRGEGIAQVHPDGSGLGLYIVKKIVTSHGGKVWAESDGKGKGTMFYVELPYGPLSEDIQNK